MLQKVGNGELPAYKQKPKTWSRWSWRNIKSETCKSGRKADPRHVWDMTSNLAGQGGPHREPCCPRRDTPYRLHLTKSIPCPKDKTSFSVASCSYILHGNVLKQAVIKSLPYSSPLLPPPYDGTRRKCPTCSQKEFKVIFNNKASKRL